MAEFKVNLPKLKEALGELRTEKGNLSDKVSDLRSSEQTLSAKWEGDAKDSFEAAFNDDVKIMNNFIDLVQQYADVLQSVIDTYAAAESANIATGTTRTSR